MYHVYYLPNAYRKYTNALGETKEIFGKVGYSSLTPEHRKNINEAGTATTVPLDVSGHEILAWARTKEEAKMFEQQYQVCYDCVDKIQAWLQKGRNTGSDNHFYGKNHTSESKSSISNKMVGNQNARKSTVD